MKTKRTIKARRLYQRICPDGSTSPVTCLQETSAPPAKGYATFPVAVIDISDPEALVGRAREAAFSAPLDQYGAFSPTKIADAVLTSLNILPKPRKGRK